MSLFGIMSLDNTQGSDENSAKLPLESFSEEQEENLSLHGVIKNTLLNKIGENEKKEDVLSSTFSDSSAPVKSEAPKAESKSNLESDFSLSKPEAETDEKKEEVKTESPDESNASKLEVEKNKQDEEKVENKEETEFSEEKEASKEKETDNEMPAELQGKTFSTESLKTKQENEESKTTTDFSSLITSKLNKTADSMNAQSEKSESAEENKEEEPKESSVDEPPKEKVNNEEETKSENEKENDETKKENNEEEENAQEAAASNNEPEQENEQEQEVPSLSFTGRIVQQYSPEELDRELDRFIKSGELPPYGMLKPIQQHISRRRVEAISNSQYEVGEKMNEAQRKIKIAIEKQRTQEDANYEERTTKDRLEEAKAELKQAQNEKHQALERIQQMHDQKMDELLMRHKVEFDEFEKFWQNPKSFHDYNKPSMTLINLRAKEKNFALTNDFENAKIIKKRADRLEKEETERAQKKAYEGMKAQLKILEMRQQKEVEGLERLTKKQVLAATVKLDANILPIDMAVKKLERMKKEPAVPKRQVVVSKSVLVTARSLGSSQDDKPPVSTPRTMRRLANIRATAKSNTLELTPIDAAPLIKRVKKNTSPRKEKKQPKDDF